MKQTAPFAVMIALLIVAGISLVNWLNYKLKNRLLDSGPADESLLKMIAKIWEPGREALKWGLLLLSAGIGLIIIYLMPDDDAYQLPDAGIELICIAAGFLAYYGITYRKKIMKIKYLLCLATLAALSQRSFGQNNLAARLAARDSLLFNAVMNTCDMQQVEGIFTAGFAYEQDKGDGKPAHLTPRSEFIGNIKRRCTVKNPQFQVRRVLVAGTVAVQELDPKTALQSGMQRFYLKAGGQPEQMVEESHFTRTWVMENGSWKMSHELDYQINNSSPQDAAAKNDTLFKQVTGADSTLFDAYNRKDIGPMKTIFASDLEFYHDKGGLSHYQDNIENFEKKFHDPNFYSRREVDKSSLKVFPLNNYGAVEMGVHRFYSMENGKEVLTATANFINTWHHTGGHWELERVISYDHH